MPNRDQNEKKRRGIGSAAKQLRETMARNGQNITQTQAQERVRRAVRRCENERK